MILAIGAKNNDGNGSNLGHVRVFARDGASAAYFQRGSDINGEAEFDQSGYPLAMSSDGTILAIGAIYNGGNGSVSDHVRMFVWDGDSTDYVRRGLDFDGEATYDNSAGSLAMSSDGGIFAIGAG